MLQLDAKNSAVVDPRPPLTPDASVSIGDIVRMLTAHIWFILACSLIGLAAAVIFVSFEAPVYEASATVRFDPGRASSLGLSDLTSPSSDQGDAIHTEIAIIKSDSVAIRTLNGLTDEQFYQWAGHSAGRTMIPDKSEVLSPRDSALIAGFESNTVVTQEAETQLLQIKFRDRSPRVAAMMANHLVDSYSLQNFESRDKSVAQLRVWLSAQMATLKQQVESSQKKLASFQESNNIIGTTDTRNTIIDRLALLNNRLTEAQANRITKEAQMRAATTGDAVTLASLFPNPKLQALQTTKGELYGQYAQLSAKFSPKYAPLVEIKQQMQIIDSEIASSVQSVKNQLNQEYVAANTTQNMLQHEYDQQAQLAYAFNRNQAEYAVLQAEVTSSRELYDMLQRKLQQAAVDTQINSVETVLVDSARAPIRPIAPKKMLTVVSGLFLGLFAGVISAFLFESTSDRVRTPEQIEKAVGYPMLATITLDLVGPAPKRIGSPGAEMVEVLAPVALQRPLSQGAEAYRVLRNALLSGRRSGVKTILFASPTPADGLSIVAVNFAISLAQTGAKVLLVEADLRQPTLHASLREENSEGLGDYLSGNIAEPLARQPVNQLPNLSFITSGERPPLPAEGLASARFHYLLERWQDSYDYVILKAAPLLVVSDGLRLASWVDCTVLVARYKVTQIPAMANVRSLLNQSNAHVAGFVLLGAPSSATTYSSLPANGDGYYV